MEEGSVNDAWEIPKAMWTFAGGGHGDALGIKLPIEDWPVSTARVQAKFDAMLEIKRDVLNLRETEKAKACPQIPCA
ncbi:MAG: hypothetical protein ABSF26_31695 [Thermoguttaceae bacterium]